MRRGAIIGALICLLLAAGPAWGAGSAAVWSRTFQIEKGSNRQTQVVSVALTSDDETGAVSSTSAGSYHGFIVSCTTNPDGTDVPDADWDLDILLDGGTILNGAGLNRSATVTGGFEPLNVAGNPNWPRVDGPLTVSATNMGNEKKAVVTFTIYGN